MKQRYFKIKYLTLTGIMIFLSLWVNLQAASQKSERGLDCQTTNGQPIPIIDKELNEPFKIIRNQRETVIVYDRWLLKDIPPQVILFNLSRYCVELRDPFETRGSIPSTDPSAEQVERKKLSEEEKDCQGILLLKQQNLIDYRDFYEIVDFYSEWKNISRTEPGDPNRVKELLQCYKKDRPKKPNAPSGLKMRAY